MVVKHVTNIHSNKLNRRTDSLTHVWAEKDWTNVQQTPKLYSLGEAALDDRSNNVVKGGSEVTASWRRESHPFGFEYKIGGIRVFVP